MNINITKWIVNVQNFSFSPSNLPNVNVGDTIRWVWVNGSHTTTSSAIPFGAASWDEPINSSNTFYEYNVTIQGTYNYVCTPHASGGMIASFTATALIPTLLSIVPDQATQGDSFLATITGSNTNFSGSPSVSLSFSNNPFEVVVATSVTIITPTVLHAQFTLPINASVGLWDLHVNSLQLQDAFTVIEVIPYIVSIEPDSADQGTSVTSIVQAVNSYFTLSDPNVKLSFSSDPNEIIPATFVNVINDTNLEANFDIPLEASVGKWDLIIGTMVLEDGFTVTPKVGLNDPMPIVVKVYPNPSSNSLFLDNANGAEVIIYNLKGQSVWSKKIKDNRQVVDLSRYDRGVYFVEILMDGQSETEKLILN